MTRQESLELAAFKAYIETGSYDAAAELVGTSMPALQSRLLRMRRRYGVKGSSIALLHVLQAKGLVSLTWGY